MTQRIDIERQKDSFISVASHELKTPLTSVKAYMQLMEVKATRLKEPFFVEALSKANLQVNKMTRMINAFLNLSHFESGNMHLNKAEFELNDLVDEIVKECQVIMPEHRITFSKTGSGIIFGDRDKISSVISNLISNADKYSPPGKPILIQTASTERSVVLSVKDEGVGVKAEDQTRLFDRYYRIFSEQNKNVSGFGIGLYISAEIVRLHEGDIWVESEGAQGSTFHVRLPFNVMDGSSADAQEDKRAATELATALRK